MVGGAEQRVSELTCFTEHVDGFLEGQQAADLGEDFVHELQDHVRRGTTDSVDVRVL
ncbi:hypothetical protein PV367_16630 [Streptomyces europaeiscabiei]|uniref:Uncharacterized protein n=1 Tax=Streptomyces europaeiscabiei TaxID=146819 RepID=A0AAJ2PQC2_9ACTN|nr:hypothetical protein [Streptomyces europaeiscabiei]MDX3131363.1 hypothetical protein [Streptomyces europaeiscabiei]